MEIRLQRILLNLFQASLFSLALPAFAAESDSVEDALSQPSVGDLGLTPELDRRRVKIADIDTEDFELGISAGLLSVEDFETNSLVVAGLTYHVTEDFFLQARYGASEVGESSFDRLSGGASLLGSDDKDISFYDLSLGVNVFPGEAFIWDRWATNSTFFLIGGVGSTSFAGDERFTVNVGVGYQLIANDFLALNFSVRDHIFDTEITGSKKATHNFEMVAGLSFFF